MATNKDLYAVLGVSKTASQDEIRKAYRKLAKENHPDLHPGDAKAEDTFKAVSSAYSILNDEDKRRRYDAGEIDASGAETGPAGAYRRHADATGGTYYQSSAGYEDFADISDVFADLFGHGRGQGRAHTGGSGSFSMRGRDVRAAITVPFLDAVKGGKTRVALPSGEKLDISIPAGTEDGRILRLKGKGQPGLGSGEQGDLLIDISVTPHPVFSRRGSDILSSVPISLPEAVLGGPIEVETISGSVKMTVPKGCSSGKTLRLKGKGVAAGKSTGDHLVTLVIHMPAVIDDELSRFMGEWKKTHGYNPREPRKETA